MKKAAKDLLTKIGSNDLFWEILKPFSTALKPFSSAGIILRNSRPKPKPKPKPELNFAYLFRSLTVLNGPFTGLKYTSLSSVGSAIYPKLLGSYETELHPTLNKMLNENYSEIIDVGCAEGYYAIGMAKICKTAQIYAYDINEKARYLCSEMAKLNEVTVEVGSEFNSDLLSSFKFSKKGLIICDCEGYENELFNNENIENLKNCDLIIELHDFIDIEISDNLKKIFLSTHDVESIFSVDDIHKARSYDYPELAGFSLSDKKLILREGRPAIMEWIICRAKD